MKQGRMCGLLRMVTMALVIALVMPMFTVIMQASAFGTTYSLEHELFALERGRYISSPKVTK